MYEVLWLCFPSWLLIDSFDLHTDMWAVGAVLAELFTMCPIFPGER